MNATARTIDFRTKRWGHNLDVKTVSEGVMQGFCWSTPGPRVGDRVLWATEYGHAAAEVTESDWTINVDDMFKVTLRVVERFGKDGATLWTAGQ